MSLIVVRPPDRIVYWEGWGTSLAWFANAIGNDARLTRDVCMLLFSKEHGLGMNIVRYNIGGAKKEHREQYRPGGAVPCHRVAKGVRIDPLADRAQTNVLLMARDLGVSYFEAFANSPPWYLTRSQNSRGAQRPLQNNLPKSEVQAFCQHLLDVVQHFKERFGLDFQSLSPFNEPASPAWNLQMDSKQEGCYFSRGRMAAVMKALDEELTRRALNPRPHLVSFEEFCVGDTVFRHLLPLSPTHVQWHRGRCCERLHTHTYNSNIFMKPPPCLPPLQDNGFWRWVIRRAVARRNRQLLSGPQQRPLPPAAGGSNVSGEAALTAAAVLSDAAAATAGDTAHTHHPGQQQQQELLKQRYHHRHGVQVWVSEFGSGGSAAELAAHVLHDLMTLEPAAWVYWQAMEDEGSPWGLLTGPISKAAAAAVAAEEAAAAAAAAAATAAGEAGASGAAAAAAGENGGTSTAASITAAAAAARAEVSTGETSVPLQPAAEAGEAAVQGSGSISISPAAVEGDIVLQPQYQVMRFLIASLKPGAQVFRIASIKPSHHRQHHDQGHAATAGTVGATSSSSGSGSKASSSRRRRKKGGKPRLRKGLLGVGAWYPDSRELLYVLANTSTRTTSSSSSSSTGNDQQQVELDLSAAWELAESEQEWGRDSHEQQQHQQQQRQQQRQGQVVVKTRVLRLEGLQPAPANLGAGAFAPVEEQEQVVQLGSSTSSSSGAGGAAAVASEALEEQQQQQQQGQEVLSVAVPANSLMSMRVSWRATFQAATPSSSLSAAAATAAAGARLAASSGADLAAPAAATGEGAAAGPAAGHQQSAGRHAAALDVLGVAEDAAALTASLE